LRLFLTRLVGGGTASGGESGGRVAVCTGGALSQARAAMTGDDGCGRGKLSRAAVAAAALSRLVRRRRRRRLFTAVAAYMEETGKVHVIVTVCRPAAWLKDTRAFSPLSMHRSYKAEKSAEETDGGGLEQAGSPTQVTTPPLTTLVHVGEAREVGGAGEGFECCGLACPAGSPAAPATPAKGEAEWRGARRGDCPAASWCTPRPHRGGGWQLAGHITAWREETLPRRGLAAN
jgi:hypothetical protein